MRKLFSFFAVLTVLLFMLACGESKKENIYEYPDEDSTQVDSDKVNDSEKPASDADNPEEPDEDSDEPQEPDEDSDDIDISDNDSNDIEISDNDSDNIETPEEANDPLVALETYKKVFEDAKISTDKIDICCANQHYAVEGGRK